MLKCILAKIFAKFKLGEGKLMPQWALIVIAVVVIAIAGAIVSSQNSDNDTTETTNCPTKCIAVGEFECNSGRYLGWCFGWWSCPSSVPNGCE